MTKLFSTRTGISLASLAGILALGACASGGSDARYGGLYESGDCCYQSECAVNMQECGYVVQEYQFQNNCVQPCAPPPPACPPVGCLPPPPVMTCPMGTSLSADGSYCLKVEYREKEMVCPSYTTPSADGTHCIKTEYKTEWKTREMTCPAGTQLDYSQSYCVKTEYREKEMICPDKTRKITTITGTYCKK